MAKTPINEQFIKKQKLAGVITESQYVTELRKLNENEDPASVWNNLPDAKKYQIIAGCLDGGEGIDDYEEATYDQLRYDMKNALQDYINDPSSLDEYSAPGERPNSYHDSAENSNLDLYGDHPYDNDGIDVSNESKKSKMTKTELKEAIRQEILAALTEDNLTEAEDEEEEEIALDAETEETPADDTEAESDGAAGDTTDSQDVQKELTDALEAAKKLGDKKLVRQIGNALTYFTRQQISSEEEM